MAAEKIKKINLFGQEFVLSGSNGTAGGSGGGVWPSRVELM